jgi:predicted AAA+ superfamily ATPase
MGFASFFNKPEHKKFNIQPRYWDPAKEEREERERRIKGELGIKDDNDQFIPNIKGRMKSELRHGHSGSSNERNKSNIRMLVIFVVLCFAAYIYLYGWDGVM